MIVNKTCGMSMKNTKEIIIDVKDTEEVTVEEDTEEVIVEKEDVEIDLGKGIDLEQGMAMEDLSTRVC